MHSKKGEKIRLATTIIGTILCIVFGFMLICNLIIIVKGSLNPQKPPSIFGKTPMVVLTGSMSGTADDHIEAGDLIFVGKTEPEKLNVGDVISFMEENSTSVVTHRILEIQKDEDGERIFITKGDANNVQDDTPVTVDRLVGIYEFRIGGAGNFAMFLQQPLGMILFIGVPLFSFIIYDIIRRQRSSKKEQKQNDEMQAELERLRKLAGEKSENQ